MSYAGNAVRGRRPAPRDGAASTAPRHRAAAADRAVVRSMPISPARTGQRPLPQDADGELDWQRVALFATGAVLGAAVGAGAALLLAPQTGEETRRDIARQGRRMRVRTADAWDDLRDELRWAAHRGQRRLSRTLRDRRSRRHERDLLDNDD